MTTVEIRKQISDILGLYYSRQITGIEAKAQLQSISLISVIETSNISTVSLETVIDSTIKFIDSRANYEY